MVSPSSFVGERVPPSCGAPAPVRVFILWTTHEGVAVVHVSHALFFVAAASVPRPFRAMRGNE
ncbi:MAG: hypothetical protein ACOYH4_00010 [Saccharofermentanales bacterium]|jgi:hypothetical protein